MSAGINIPYDDEWILSRWGGVRNWAVLCREYNAAHGSNIGYNTFKSHCNRELGLNYHYSEEQDEWLKENYPHLGRRKTTEAFNKRFKTNKTAQAIKLHCNKNLNLRVTEERRKQVPVENSGRSHPIGTVMVKGNYGVVEKTANGWERITDRVIGKAPKGCRTIHLDGDILNNDASNLVHMSFERCALMTRYELWSVHSTITKTGIKWCELYEKIKGEDYEYLSEDA